MKKEGVGGYEGKGRGYSCTRITYARDPRATHVQAHTPHTPHPTPHTHRERFTAAPLRRRDGPLRRHRAA